MDGYQVRLIAWLGTPWSGSLYDWLLIGGYGLVYCFIVTRFDGRKGWGVK